MEHNIPLGIKSRAQFFGQLIPSLISTKLSSTNSILNSTYFEFGAKTSILRKLDAVKKNSKYRLNCRLIFVYTIHSSNNPPKIMFFCSVLKIITQLFQIFHYNIKRERRRYKLIGIGVYITRSGN